MKYVFVCCYGQHRSPAAAQVLKEMLAERGKTNGEIRHAGIEPILLEHELDAAHARMFEGAEPTAMLQGYEREFFQRRNTIEEMRRTIRGADRVFVMEPSMIEKVRQRTGYSGEITVLGIPNSFTSSQDPTLRARLREKLESYI